jgi:hypothetical protein
VDLPAAHQGRRTYGDQARSSCGGSKSGKKLLALRTDRGGEFATADFIKYCTELGVHRQLTAPYTPQQNGVVERRNQSVVGTACSMLTAKGLLGEFWGEAVTTAVYLLNRSSSKGVGGKTPYELWTGSVPAVQHLRTFGSVVHMKVMATNLRKLDDKSKHTIFVGYEPGSKAYLVYDPVTRRVHVSRDVVFEEAAQWTWTEGQRDEAADFIIDDLMPSEIVTTTTMTSARTSTTTASTPASPAPSTHASPVHDAGTATMRVHTQLDADSVEFVSPPRAGASQHLDADHDTDACSVPQRRQCSGGGHSARFRCTRAGGAAAAGKRG